MFKKIGLFITNLIHTLDNRQDKGFSARKATALFGVLTGAYITKYHLPEEDQLYALISWQMLSLLCLGIVTFEQVIKLKNGNDEKPTETNNNDSNSNPIN